MSKPPTSPVRGLTTLALLSAYHDQGKDYLEMFMPFVLDQIHRSGAEPFRTADMRQRIRAEHGLTIPSAPLERLLRRATRRGFVRREGGVFVPVPGDYDQGDMSRAQAQIEREHWQLAEKLRAFANGTAVTINGNDQALALLFGFVAQNELELLLESGVAVPAAGGERGGGNRLVAHFLQQVVMPDPVLYPYLERMLEGFVLQKALLLKDVRSSSDQFRGLGVYFDSGFLWGVLGLLGEQRKLALREAIELIREAGARLGVFTKTIDEMKSILAMFERKLATVEGRDSLWQTPLTRFFLQNHYTPGQVQLISAKLEVDLRALNIQPTNTPRRTAIFTTDELGLAKALGREEEEVDSPRVVHDVDCIAAVQTLRRGHQPASLNSARAVFVTASPWVARRAINWFRENEHRGIPPIVFHTTLSDLAWLKMPAHAPKLKINELVAVCQAAIAPSRRLVIAFRKHLRWLEQEGSLTSDETVAIVVSDLTEQLLADLDDDAEVDYDADTLSEIVDRVRDTYRDEAQKDVETAKGEAAVAIEAKRRLELRVIGLASRIANVLAWSMFLVGLVGVVGGFLFSLPGMLEYVPSEGIDLVFLLIGAFGILCTFSLVNGATLGQMRLNVEARLKSWLRSMLTAGAPLSDTDSVNRGR